jgi:hypothetical protein
VFARHLEAERQRARPVPLEDGLARLWLEGSPENGAVEAMQQIFYIGRIFGVDCLEGRRWEDDLSVAK